MKLMRVFTQCDVCEDSLGGMCVSHSDDDR